MWNVRAKLAAQREVSFERDGLDASKACHISASGNVRSRAAGSGSAGRKREDCRSVISRYCFECLQIKQAKGRVICLSGSEGCCQAQNPVAHFFRLFRRSRHEWLCAN